MLVIYYCGAVCNVITTHYSVMFTLYGVHHFGRTYISVSTPL